MPLRIADLDTPAVIIALDILEDNIHRMQEMMNSCGVGFRPHIKTHKIPEIAQMQIKAGAVGVTCQKIGEAEIMSAAGVKDILISYNIIGKQKLDRLTRLARCANITCAVDSEFTARGIAEAAVTAAVQIKLVIELDTGKRVGVQNAAQAVALAKVIQRLDGVRLVGVMGYPTSKESAPFIASVIEAFKADGLPLEIVSGGGTVSAYSVNDVAGLTEHRAGTYAYNDMTCVRRGVATIDQCAQRIVCTVVSRPDEGRAIIDGGSKTFTNDAGAPFGHIIEYPDAQIYQQSEEHGHVDVSNCKRKPAIGERVTVIANHACGTTNLHDEVYGVRNGVVEVVWPVAARGTIR